MVAATLKEWGRVDILVNNAGILRDKSFAKMSLEDFKAVLDVHVMGAATCTKAVWEIMREANYGRVVMTSSSSGIYGNFGQSNYGAAKMGLVGFMNVLHLEGAKNNIRVNALSPTARTRMTEGLIPEEALALMTVESVSAGLVYLVSEDAPSRTVLCAGAGGLCRDAHLRDRWHFSAARGADAGKTSRSILTRSSTRKGRSPYEQGGQQTMKFIAKAAAAAGVKLG